MVGERGPEMFIPRTAGSIEPAGGDETVVNIDMRGIPTARGDDAASAAELARKVRAAVLDVLRNEKRPGGMLMPAPGGL
jgi:phage-related minor tail protein